MPGEDGRDQGLALAHGPHQHTDGEGGSPHSLRARFGTDGTQNATHGSDSPASAARELKFFFPNAILDPVPEGAAAREYIQAELTPVLVKGFAALCKEKPSAQRAGGDPVAGGLAP